MDRSLAGAGPRQGRAPASTGPLGDRACGSRHGRRGSRDRRAGTLAASSPGSRSVTVAAMCTGRSWRARASGSAHPRDHRRARRARHPGRRVGGGGVRGRLWPQIVTEIHAGGAGSPSRDDRRFLRPQRPAARGASSQRPPARHPLDRVETTLGAHEKRAARYDEPYPIFRSLYERARDQGPLLPGLVRVPSTGRCGDAIPASPSTTLASPRTRSTRRELRRTDARLGDQPADSPSPGRVASLRTDEPRARRRQAVAARRVRVEPGTLLDLTARYRAGTEPFWSQPGFAQVAFVESNGALIEFMESPTATQSSGTQRSTRGELALGGLGHGTARRGDGALPRPATHAAPRPGRRDLEDRRRRGPAGFGCARRRGLRRGRVSATRQTGRTPSRPHRGGRDDGARSWPSWPRRRSHLGSASRGGCARSTRRLPRASTMCRGRRPARHARSSG